MIDEKTRKQIEAYIPSPRDKSLRPYCDYYVNQNGRVKRGHARELFETDDGDDLIGLVDGAYDDWERLRRIQEGGNG